MLHGDGDLHNASHEPYTVRLPTIALAGEEVSEGILEEASGQNVSGVLVSPDDSEDVPLHWGEVIPLLMVPSVSSRGTGIRPLFSDHQRQLSHLESPSQQRRRHIILSHTLRRFKEAPAMVPELLRLGVLLREWMDDHPSQRNTPFHTLTSAEGNTNKNLSIHS